MREDINQLPSIGIPARDQTHNLGVLPIRNGTCDLLVHSTMLAPPTEPQAGVQQIFKFAFSLLYILRYSYFLH